MKVSWFNILDLVGDYDEEDEITFKQWTNVDRSTLTTITTTIDEFIDKLVNSLQTLTTHSFLAKSQAGYLRRRKDNIDDKTALFLGDFAENYTFIAQDAVQSFHWNNTQCTLHPVVVYFRENGYLRHHSFCVLSDDLKHDVDMVHEVQNQILSYIRDKYPNIKNIEYFTDGCSGQYKNKKHFKNLCLHKEDFKMSAKWNFFATSHGKSPCDGIGGSLKRATMKASLQRIANNHILSPKDMFEFCNISFEIITSFFVSAEQMAVVRATSEERYKNLMSIPGTRSFHQFNPVGGLTLTMKRSSLSEKVDMRYDLCNAKILYGNTVDDFTPLQYVACVYSGNWWIGMIEAVNPDEQDADVRFMKPHGPSQYFSWPSYDDTEYY